MNKKMKFALPAGIAVLGVACVGLFSIYGHASAASPKTRALSGSQSAQGYMLPGGASSLNETYQDWRVVCQRNNTSAQCLIVQQENENKTQQHILTLELQPKGDKMAGFATLPFGLALAKGVTVQTDGHPATDEQMFTTCVPAGCLVPIALNTTQLTQIQKGTKVEVRAFSVNGQPVVIPFSNKGLEQAIARITALKA